MKKALSVVEGILHAFVSLGALAAGALMILSPQGNVMQMPLSMLRGSPFRDFLVPGIILFTINGLGQALAAVLCFTQHRLAAYCGAMFGLGLMIWIFLQVSFIGGGHWLQYLYFALGLAEASLAVLLVQGPFSAKVLSPGKR